MLMLPPRKSAKSQQQPNPQPAAKDRHQLIPQGLYIAKLFDVTSRGGEYKGRIQINPVRTGTTDVKPADIGTDWTSDDTSVIYCLNPAELSASTHTLKTDGSVFVAVQVITYNTSDGKPVGMIVGVSASALPTPTALYQVVICAQYIPANGNTPASWTWAADFPRVHS